MTPAEPWTRLRHALVRARPWSPKRERERRSAEARARFWNGVREGEREAELGVRR